MEPYPTQHTDYHFLKKTLLIGICSIILLILDTPIEERIKFIWEFLKETQSRPIFITGRNEVIWDDTVDFIEKHFFDDGEKENITHIGTGATYHFQYDEFWVRMRSEKDRRKAYEMKKIRTTRPTQEISYSWSV